MLNKETKKKIDNCRDILVGVLPLPSDQVELITISLIYKFMDDIDEQSRQLGGAVSFFRNGLKVYSWQNLMSNQLSAEERVLKFIKAIEELTKAPHIPELFKSIFRNTFLKFRDGRVFKLFLDEINYFSYDNSEELGNAFEYLLNTMGAQGENGQFRTPRNIIDFIVEVVDPDKDDKILDPACGTAGFLISAYKHILRKYTTGYENYRISLNNQSLESNGIHWGDKLLASQKSKLAKRIEGYDNTPLMVRLSQVNMYLHHFPNPAIHDYDSITYSNRWSDKYDCILANPPFMTPKGGVKAHDKFRIRAKKTEILFSDYIIEHLTPNGKAGWIVPEGIIFQNIGDYVDLRKWLINDMGLWAVVSLPAQIFQPYSGVKTSILLVDRALARLTENIILVKIENDGFSLNTNRNPIKENDLPAALNLLTEYKKNPSVIPRSNSERSEEGARNLKYKILHRKDFAKLDSYKSTTAAIDFCRKEFKDLQKAEEKYQESLQKELTDKQKQKAEERIKNLRSIFLINTGFNAFPIDETSIKQLVEDQLKDQVVLYGEDSENHVNLSSNLKKAIDWQREYNLSIDKYFEQTKISQDVDIIRLVDCATIIPGQSPSSEFYNTTGEGLPFYQGKTEFGDNLLDVPRVWTTEITRISIKDDILFSMRAPVGSINKNPFEKICIGRGLAAIRPNELISKDYLFYFLLFNQSELSTKGNSGSVFDSITKEQLESIKIPLPPLEIQQKIVTEIEQYRKVIDGCNLVIQNYKPTFKIDESWERVRMIDVCEFVRGPFGGSLKKEIFVEKGFKVYEQKHAIRNDFSIGTYFIDKEKYEEMARFQLEADNLIMSCSGTFGKVAIFPKNAEPGIINQALLKLIPHTEKIKPQFLKLIMESEYFQNQIIRGAIGVAIQNVVSVDEIKSFDLPLPSLSVQQKIVDQLQSEMQAIEQCKHLKTQMENKIKEVLDSLWQTN